MCPLAFRVRGYSALVGEEEERSEKENECINNSQGNANTISTCKLFQKTAELPVKADEHRGRGQGHSGASPVAV